MKKVFIIHGFQGSPNGGWRPWLMSELAKSQIYACALAMPDPNNPHPDQWIAEISRHVKENSRDQIFLVGHSLGVPAILRYIEKEKPVNVRGLILVSGPVFKTSKQKVAEFLKEPFDFGRISQLVKKIVVIHGDNDKSVSIDQGKTLAKELKAELIIIKNGGHLNGSAGWFTFPQCLEALNRMID